VGAFADLISHRHVEDQSPQGGLPIRYVELFGGVVVEALGYPPDPETYRHGFYYNAVDNHLYKKVGEWMVMNVDVAVQGDYAIVDGMRVDVMVNEPRPNQYSGRFYYHAIRNKLYRKSVRWVAANNV
jgi:hypothetical protein